MNIDCVNYTIEKQCSINKLKEYLVDKFHVDQFGRLRKDVKAKAILQKSDNRPHIVKVRRSSFVQASLGHQELLELKEEIRLMIFCWDDISGLSDEEFIKKEVKKMSESMAVVFQDFQKNIDILQH